VKVYAKALMLVSLVFWHSLLHAALPPVVEDALKTAGIAQSGVAVYVQAVDSEQPLYTQNASLAMNPASVMKLVTTYTALDMLSPAYRWKTEVYRDGELSNGVLKGNLILKGYGDPSFKAPQFWALLMRLQQAGIKQIKGDLIIDKTAFAENVGQRETFDEETWRAYNASPSAFLVNGRNTSFRFSVVDEQVLVDQEFALPEVSIVNHMKLSKGACGSWRNYFSYDVAPKANGAVVTFNGTYTTDCGERYLELSVMDDAQYAYATFKKLWAELGGKFSGKLQVKAMPDTALKVLEQESDPLGYVVRDINKWSNNLMARQLLLSLALEQKLTPANEALGTQALKAWLSSKGLNFNEMVIENGSGLSRIERISAQHLGQMLVSAYRSPVMPELLSSLPIVGLDGTAKKRLKDAQVSGRAHIKTGSLNGVSAIAGYILSAQGKRYVVVMIVNDGNAAASKKAQDALMEQVYLN
jgi:serine-type D-Ala-D-Ala carboxypeptidase/endopeptidase (penicillin-binding protein 4)